MATYKAGELVAPVTDFSEVPLETYTVQINKVDPTPSKRTNAAMDKFEIEILAPDSVEFGGRKVTTAGRKGEFYVVYSPKNLYNVAQKWFPALGITLDPKTEIDIPDEAEVTSKARTTCNLQAITAQLVGGQFQVKLATDNLPERVGKDEPGFDPTRPVWEQAVKKNAAGNVLMTTMHKLRNINPEDIVSPINNVRIDMPY